LLDLLFGFRGTLDKNIPRDNIRRIKRRELFEKDGEPDSVQSTRNRKTYMTAAIGIATSNWEKKDWFCRTAMLVNKLVEAKSKVTLKRALNTFRKINSLICSE